jgi:hypothetical protein
VPSALVSKEFLNLGVLRISRSKSKIYYMRRTSSAEEVGCWFLVWDENRRVDLYTEIRILPRPKGALVYQLVDFWRVFVRV